MRLIGLAPVWRADARVLVLGSFPGAASLQATQYYAHPRNAFWPVMAAVLAEPDLPGWPYPHRLERLQAGGIALWDAVGECERQGSLDSAIRAAQPSDLRELVARLPALRLIACNGATAYRETEALLPGAPWPLLKLPSTSPAHAGLPLEAKISRWCQALALVAPDAGDASNIPEQTLGRIDAAPAQNAPPMPLDPDSLPEVTVSEHAGVRCLHLDSIWVQGAMRNSKPLQLELDYVQRMMAPLLFQPPSRWREGWCVQLGLGAAALTKFCHQVLGRPTTAVELHPGVLLACRQWFQLPPDDDLLKVELANAADWVRRPEHQGRVQLLHIDLYDHEAAAPVLDSEAFYADCRGLLAPDGVLAVNLFGRRASFDASCGRLLKVFGEGHVWRLAATKEGNTVVLATRENALPAKPELQQRATNMNLALGLPAARWLRGLKPCDPVPPTA